MSDKNKVLTPMSSAPNFDAMQVMPLNTDRATKVELSGGIPAIHTLAADTEMAFIYIPFGADGSPLFIEVTRGSDLEKSIPLASGYWPWGVVGDPRTVSFKLASGNASITIMEA